MDTACRPDEIELTRLPVGARAVVASIRASADDQALALRLLELGFVEGEPLRIVALGQPGGDPIAVRLGGRGGAGAFALRRREAALIRVRTGGAA